MSSVTQASKTAYTPGPWSVGIVVPGEPGMTEGTRTVEAPYDGEPQTVAFVHPSTDGEGSNAIDAAERDANAHLIAASPDLLESLRAFLHYAPAEPFGLRDPRYAAWSKIRQQAETAIAKAAAPANASPAPAGSAGKAGAP